MSEQVQNATDVIKPSYEAVRDSYPAGEDSDGSPTVGTLWRDSDRWRSQLRDSVNEIMTDETLSEEGKQQGVEAAYARWSPRITAPARQARDKATKLAAEYSQRSVPMPEGSAFSSRIESATELSAIQTEAREIVEAAKGNSLSEKIERRTGRRPRNVQDSGSGRLEALRTYYSDALEAGGVEGKIQAHAVLRAATSLGINTEDIYSPFRTDSHNHYLQESRQYQAAARSIRTQAPDLMSRSSQRGNHWRSASKSPTPLVTGGSKGFLPQNKRQRKPSWK